MADRRSHMGFDHHNMTPSDAGAVIPQVIWKTQDGIVIAYGLTVPVDTTAGYVPGALFFDVDAALYINTGSATSCAFKAYGAVDVTGNVAGNVAGNVTGNITSAILAGSISTTPTQAELVAICGVATTAGAGARRLVQGNDGTGSGNLYTVVSNGTNWFAVNMPIGTS